MKSMIAHDIEWDVDDPENTDYLPKSIPIPKELISDSTLNDIDSLAKAVSIVSDYITEKTGFCNKSFVIDMSYENETHCRLNIKEDVSVSEKDYTAAMDDVKSKTWNVMRTVCQLFGVDFDNPDEIPRIAVNEITEQMLCYAEMLTGKKINDIIIK